MDNQQISSAQWVDESRQTIRALVDGRELFVPDDMANTDRRRLKEDWEDKGHAIADPPALPPQVPEVISDRQFFQQLAVQGIITQAEALAAVKTGDIPAALQALIDALPAEQKFPAEMIVSGAVEFHRGSVLVREIAQAYGWSADEVDTLWRNAGTL
jgi:hypothetical protein